MGLPYNQNVRLKLISTTLGHSHTIRKQIVTQIQMDEKLACLWKTNYRYSDVICEAFLFSLSYFCAWSKLDIFDSTKNRKNYSTTKMILYHNASTVICNDRDLIFQRINFNFLEPLKR